MSDINHTINVLVGPASEPVTLDELKSQTHITHDAQDDTLEAYITMAREHAEEFQRKSFMTQNLELLLDGYPLSEVRLLFGPIQDVESVMVITPDNEAILLDLDLFDIDISQNPGRFSLKENSVYPNYSMRKYGGFRIRYRVGYPSAATVPAPVKHAIKLFASFADDNRAAETVELPMSFYNLLRPARVPHNEP